jgi:hypothetical protein
VGPSERIVSIAKAVQECAFAHEPDARLIGNVCAEDVADLCNAVLARWGRPAAPPAPQPEDDWFAVALIAQDMRSRGMAEQACGDELLRLANSNRSQPAAARAALKAEPASDWPTLQWTESMPPNNECRYDHCIAETPFGRFLITWKSWKDYDSPTVDETPWGYWGGGFNSVDEAKAACQQGMNERLARWGRPATPPAPEPAPAADPPLWQLMLHAYDNAPAPSRGAPDDWTDRQGYAAEILAVRDRVVPEERGVLHQVHDPELHRWRERQRIRAMLTTEAARAEAGE